MSVETSTVEGPHATDKQLFMNALGALLASTMTSELDEDGCEADWRDDPTYNDEPMADDDLFGTDRG